MSPEVVQEDDSDHEKPSAKRAKLDHHEGDLDEDSAMAVDIQTTVLPIDSAATPPGQSALPPSRTLLGESHVKLSDKNTTGHTLEFDVGISEYISKSLPPIHAIIKQRFTDFLVNEINQDGNVMRVSSLEIPRSEKNENVHENGEAKPGLEAAGPSNDGAKKSTEENSLDEKNEADIEEPWPDRFTSTLQPFLSEIQIEQLKQMYLEGPEPPFVSDSGWTGRKSTEAQVAEGTGESPQGDQIDPTPSTERDRGQRGKRGRDRGGRGRGGGRRNERGRCDDPRKVVTDPIESKASRTGLHKLIRELFKGKLESETDTKGDSEHDGRIVIKWTKRGQGRDAGRGQGNRELKPRGSYPPYIHFTMQKTNRDTQDALGHLSRLLRCNVKDFSVAGTKDKRGVTVQRVSLRRGSKTVEDVWKIFNGANSQKTLEDVLKKRGERGVRVSDFRYRKAGLELGMLKGNVFLITLRNVQVEPLDILDKAMQSLKEKGFINYYGMQRFGTASIPTHSIGLAFLQQDWQRAVNLILQHRPGEHPDVVAARDAWLVEKDLDKALQLFPRRVVAERCILESFKKMKGDTRNAYGALSTIPRNLRLMYVHAYQSYIWNAIVSERIRMHGAEKPAPGDIVYERTLEEDEQAEDSVMNVNDDEDSSNKGKKPWAAPRVNILTADDIENYSVFDVLMPLPGKDVAYPGGSLGERYKEFLKMDGLNPDNISLNKHKDYNLSGSYRKMVLKPKELSWKILRYTDPDVPLAQSDEDKLLGFEPPVVDETGKFVALQIELQLSTAAYATMALREITKTETSSHYQISLTASSEDQAFRGTIGKD